ncbi:Uncharacterised protein [Vibrio cholerae]|nr:Uncharacterised protein [Vibrio cholerae]
MILQTFLMGSDQEMSKLAASDPSLREHLGNSDL